MNPRHPRAWGSFYLPHDRYEPPQQQASLPTLARRGDERFASLAGSMSIGEGLELHAEAALHDRRRTVLPVRRSLTVDGGTATFFEQPYFDVCEQRGWTRVVLALEKLPFLYASEPISNHY